MELINKWQVFHLKIQLENGSQYLVLEVPEEAEQEDLILIVLVDNLELKILVEVAAEEDLILHSLVDQAAVVS